MELFMLIDGKHPNSDRVFTWKVQWPQQELINIGSSVIVKTRYGLREIEVQKIYYVFGDRCFISKYKIKRVLQNTIK